MRYLLFIVLAATSAAYGQDYQPLHSHSLQVFYQETHTWIGGNMWGTRIDSVSVGPDGDTTYFNYAIIRDSVAENGWTWGGENCAWWNAPNWDGLRTVTDTLGNTRFVNADTDTILLWHSAPVGSQWAAHTYANGDTLMASVVSMAWADDEWMADSVKTIGFTRMQDGMEVNDPVNSVTLELYRTAGFRRTVDFTRFPGFTEPLLRIDHQTINSYFPNPIPPAVGHGYRFTRDCYHFGIAGMPHEYNYESSVITDVQETGTEGVLQVTRQQNRQTATGTITVEEGWTVVTSPLETEITVEPHNTNAHPLDTFMTLRTLDGLNLMPREKNAGYVLRPDEFSIHLGCASPLVRIEWCDPVIDWQPSPEDSCLAGIGLTSGCWPRMITHHRPYYGTIREYSVSYATDALEPECNTTFSWFDNGLVECGENRFMVSVPEDQGRPEVSMHPVPAQDAVTIRSEGQEIKGIHVHDIHGRSIHSGEPHADNAVLDCQSWPRGLYMVTIETANGSTVKKLVLN